MIRAEAFGEKEDWQEGGVSYYEQSKCTNKTQFSHETLLDFRIKKCKNNEITKYVGY